MTEAKEKKLMTVNLIPLYDMIIVKAGPKEEKTAGGIIIPGGDAETPIEALVVAVGEGYRHENGNGECTPLKVKVGHVVLFHGFIGTPVMHEGVSYRLMKESEIVGIVIPQEEE